MSFYSEVGSNLSLKAESDASGDGEGGDGGSQASPFQVILRRIKSCQESSTTLSFQGSFEKLMRVGIADEGNGSALRYMDGLVMACASGSE